MSAPDTAHSAVVSDHPFEPRDPAQPWGLCKCGLAESAHAEAMARPWVCECGRRFDTQEDAVGHLDPRTAEGGYEFCHGVVRR